MAGAGVVQGTDGREEPRLNKIEQNFRKHVQGLCSRAGFKSDFKVVWKGMGSERRTGRWLQVPCPQPARRLLRWASDRPLVSDQLGAGNVSCLLASGVRSPRARTGPSVGHRRTALPDRGAGLQTRAVSSPGCGRWAASCQPSSGRVPTQPLNHGLHPAHCNGRDSELPTRTREIRLLKGKFFRDQNHLERTKDRGIWDDFITETNNESSCQLPGTKSPQDTSETQAHLRTWTPRCCPHPLSQAMATPLPREDGSRYCEGSLKSSEVK